MVSICSLIPNIKSKYFMLLSIKLLKSCIFFSRFFLNGNVSDTIPFRFLRDIHFNCPFYSFFVVCQSKFGHHQYVMTQWGISIKHDFIEKTVTSRFIGVNFGIKICCKQMMPTGKYHITYLWQRH